MIGAGVPVELFVGHARYVEAEGTLVPQQGVARAHSCFCRSNGYTVTLREKPCNVMQKESDNEKLALCSVVKTFSIKYWMQFSFINDSVLVFEG